MPTSKKRSGKARAKPARPVPSVMPAVSATIRPSRAAAASRAAPNAALQSRAFAAGSVPDARSNGPTPCQAVGFFSAGAKPLPFRVTT